MSDPRFARLKSDPRFRRPRKQKSKVVVDDRFKSVFSQEKKSKNNKGSTRVDKYGRPLSDTQEQDNLKRFYRLDTEDEDATFKTPDYARGEVLLESSDEEDGDVRSLLHDEEDDASSDAGQNFVSLGGDPNATFEINLDEGELADLDAQAAAYQQSHPSADSEKDAQPTNRLAFVNLDWDHVRATHLFKVCSSLVSPTAPALASTSSGKPHPERQRQVKGSSNPVTRGKVLRVAVYPSQFGKGRLAREEKEGPPSEIFRKRKELDVEEVNERNIYEVGDEDEHDEDALRNYQLERLRYYYAIVTCDTVDAAAHIYAELEGSEFERSANVFDLSFVPDGMTFQDQPRDEATEEPSTGYKGVEFVTDALRHSKVKLTWDEDDPERNQITRKTLTRKEIDEADFRAYLASSSESESDTEAGLRAKATSRDRLRAMLLGGGDDLPEGWAKDADGDGDHDDVDMEITFTPGLAEGKGDHEETALGKYQRKMKEKRKKRKEELKEKDLSKKADPETAKDDFFDAGSDAAEGSTENTTPRRHRSKSSERVISTAAELSLLVSGGDTEPKHFNMKAVLDAEKGKSKKKNGRRKASKEKDEAQEDFKLDTTDDRFKVLHDDYNFAIDPSNPHFKKTKGMTALLDERSKRQHGKLSQISARTSAGRDDTGERSLQSLVESVKRKTSSLRVSRDVKRHKGS